MVDEESMQIGFSGGKVKRDGFKNRHLQSSDCITGNSSRKKLNSKLGIGCKSIEIVTPVKSTFGIAKEKTMLLKPPLQRPMTKQATRLEFNFGSL